MAGAELPSKRSKSIDMSEKSGPSGFPVGRAPNSREVRLAPQDFLRHHAGVQVRIDGRGGDGVGCWDREKRS